MNVSTHRIFRFSLVALAITAASLVACAQPWSDLSHKIFGSTQSHLDDSVVSIQTRDANGQPITRGTAFYIDDRHLVTARHVLKDAASADCHTIQGDVIKVLGVTNDSRALDLAIIEVLPKRKHTTLELADYKEGDQTAMQVVAALGSEKLPLRIGERPNLHVDQGELTAIHHTKQFGEYFEVTSSVKRGYSGGPVLVNSENPQVIGVTVMLFPHAARSETTGIVVPAKAIKKLKDNSKKLKSLPQWNEERVRPAPPRLNVQQMIEADRDAMLSLLEPKTRTSYFDRGLDARERGDLVAATRLLNQAANIEPATLKEYLNTTFIHFNLGDSYDRLGLKLKAKAAFSQAISLDGQYIGARERLSVIAIELGDIGLASEQVAQLRDLRVQSSEQLEMVLAAMSTH